MTANLDPPPKRRSRLPWIIGGVIAAALVICCGAAAVLAVFVARNPDDWGFSHTGMPSPSSTAGPVNTDLIDVGNYDCLAGNLPSGRIMLDDVDLTKVKCKDKSADYQVLNAATGVPRPEGRETSRYCSDPGVIAAVWASTDGARGTVLCLGKVFFVSN